MILSKENIFPRWFKNKMEIFHGHKYHFNSDDVMYSLTINKVEQGDGGKYTVTCNDASVSAWLYVEG